MDEAEAVEVVRAHIEAQFPRACPGCGRRFGSLREYLENTQHDGNPVSLDAEVGDWRPQAPRGTESLARCACGATLRVSTAGMSLLTVWRLMAWARREAQVRGVSLSDVVGGVRSRIDAAALGAPAAEHPAPGVEERLREWRTSLFLLYVRTVTRVFPGVLGVWLLLRPEPRFAHPFPLLFLIWVISLLVGSVLPRRHLGTTAILVLAAGAAVLVPTLGTAVGPGLVLLSAAVLATATHGLRLGAVLTVLGVAEYVGVGLLVSRGWMEPPGAAFTDPAQPSTWLRTGAFFGMATGTLVLGLSRLFLHLESAWRDEEAGAKRERRMQEERAAAEAGRRAAEDAARAAQRMEAVGRLAGGVAHDFNNLVLVLLAWTDAVSDEDPAVRAEGAANIRQAATQAAQLTRRLMTFARRDTYSPPEKPLDLDAAVAGFLGSLKRLLPSDVRLRHDRATLPGVALDETALGQVLVNLALNAGDAMPEGGELALSTSLLQPRDLPPCACDPTVPHVVLEVSDTGTGMDDETLAHVFEPFFTTKGPARGTGLGLASVYGIVQQVGGWCRVESTLGKGTTFQLGFPVMNASAALRQVSPARAAHAADVVVVEDDDQVREILASTLRADGHRVHTAPDASQALTLIRRFQGDLRMLVADGVMPGAPTRTLVDEYRRLFPRGKVLVCSGHSDEQLRLRGLTPEVAEFLPKPFHGEVLVTRVAQLLSSPETENAAAGG